MVIRDGSVMSLIRDVMHPFPADLMRMWPISTRVNKPENDDQSIIEPIELASDAA
jgi:putative SOS response-associated peptidase YedK